MDISIQALKSFGVDASTALLALPTFMMVARTPDPRSPETQTVVKGVQRGLKKLGYPIKVDGFVGKETSKALSTVSGKEWNNKHWYEIYSDLEYAIKTQGVIEATTRHETPKVKTSSAFREPKVLVPPPVEKSSFNWWMVGGVGAILWFWSKK